MARIRLSRPPAAVMLPSVESGPLAVAPPRLHTAVDLNLPPDENDRRIAAWEARRKRGVAIMRARPPGRLRIWRPRMHLRGMGVTDAVPLQARVRPLLHQPPPAPGPELVPVPVALLPPPVLVPPNCRQLRAPSAHPHVFPLTPLLPPPPYLPAVPVPPSSRALHVPRAHLGADPPPPASAPVRRSSRALRHCQSRSGPPATTAPKPLGGGSPEAPGRKRKHTVNAIGKAGANKDEATSTSPPIYLHGSAMPSREDDSGKRLNPIRWAHYRARSGSRTPRRRASSTYASLPESGSSSAAFLGNQPMRAIDLNKAPSSSTGPNDGDQQYSSSSSNAGYVDMEVQAADPEADDRSLPRRDLSLQVITLVVDLNAPPMAATRLQGRGRNDRSAWDRLPAGLFNGLPGTTLAAAERTGTLSFYLRYAIRERPWLQDNQVALTKRQCCPPKDMQPKSRKMESRKSQFQGVNFYRRTNRWEAHIWETPKKQNGKQQYLGSCYNELEAARHYDRGSLKFRGPEAPINFKSCSYNDCIKEIDLMSKDQFLEWSRCMARRCMTSQFFGTRFDAFRSKWKAEYKIQNPIAKKDGTLNRGFHDTEEEAARAYDIVSIEVSGANAITNYDISEYNIASILNGSKLNRNGLHRQEKEQALEQVHLSHGGNNARVKNYRGEPRRCSNKGKEKVPSNQVRASTSHIWPTVNYDPYIAQCHQLGPVQLDPTLTLAIAANAYDNAQNGQLASPPMTLRSRGMFAQDNVSLKSQSTKVMKLGGSDDPRADLMARFHGTCIGGSSEEQSEASETFGRKRPPSATINIPGWTVKKSRYWRPSR